MAERLLNCLETNNLLHFSQAAYRKKSRTTDHIFTFKSILNNYCLKKKQKLYCCFIDFKKAFDSVWRDAMLLKLLQLGIGGEFYYLIKNMYSITKSRIRFSKGITEYVQSELGIKQGDCLSPILFNVFINDMHSIFDNHCDGILVNDIQLNHLLFADDLVIVSETRNGLQKCLDKLHDYTQTWALDINIGKTKTIIFQRYGKRTQDNCNIGGLEIEQVNKYTYLGIPFDSSGCFTSAEIELKSKALKAMFQLQSTLNSGVRTNCNLHTKLFDTLIRPIATYGCEVWYPIKHNKTYKNENNIMHRIDKTPCELLHNAFCKRILGVYKSTSNIISKAEIGRLPLSFYIILQVIKYWNHILEKPIDSLLHQSYLSELNNSSEWTSFVKTILTLCDLQNKWDNQTILNNNDMSILKSNLRKMFLKLYCDAKKPDHLKCSFNLQLQTRSNLLMPAEYTKMNIPLIYRKGLTRIRLQSNRLGILTGRFLVP